MQTRLSVFPSHLSFSQKEHKAGRASILGKGTVAQMCMTQFAGHCLALKRPAVTFSIPLESSCGCPITTSRLSSPLVSLESPEDEGQQQGKKKAKLARAEFTFCHNQKERAPFLPPPDVPPRGQSGRPRVGPHNAPFISDSPGSPIQTRLPPLPLEFQPREHEQWMTSRPWDLRLSMT